MAAGPFVDFAYLSSLAKRNIFLDSKDNTHAYHQELQEIVNKLSQELLNAFSLSSDQDKKKALELIKEVAIHLSNEAFINAQNSRKIDFVQRFDELKNKALADLIKL